MVRQYVGSGEKGRKAAERDATERAELERLRQQAREIEAEETARLEAIEGPLDELDEKCRVIMEAALERAGFHRPKRWKWRKKRGNKK